VRARKSGNTTTTSLTAAALVTSWMTKLEVAGNLRGRRAGVQD
jgi:hypothetical protein